MIEHWANKWKEHNRKMVPRVEIIEYPNQLCELIQGDVKIEIWTVKEAERLRDAMNEYIRIFGKNKKSI